MHTVNIAGSNIWPVFIDLLFVLLSKEAKQVWGGGGYSYKGSVKLILFIRNGIK